MNALFSKPAIVIAALISAWAVMFWVQWSTEMSLQANIIGVPLVTVIMGLLAGLALNENEQ